MKMYILILLKFRLMVFNFYKCLFVSGGEEFL